VSEENLHIKDKRLVLYAGGELSARSSARVQRHLDGCPQCRARVEKLESSLDRFNQVHREIWNAALPAPEAARASLKARLAKLAAEKEAGHSLPVGSALLGRGRTAVLACAAVAMCFFVAVGWHELNGRPYASLSVGHWEEPDLRLTPGATVPVSENEVCSTTKEAPAIPVSLKQEVYDRYGVLRPKPDEYEVDYLITPELGGATDIRNLWPEPYEGAVWNAHVKDQLEDRLHRMVCRGDVDLATAQRDLSTDWIAAYRKYFHANRPVTDGSTSNYYVSGSALPST
jgi:anti-sigma factor RsiW